MDSLRKKQKEMQEIQNTVTEMRNAFDGLRLDMGERGIPELEVISGNLWGCKTASKNIRLGETVLTSACLQYSRHTMAGSTGASSCP